jgi:hypothetical protein
MREEVGHYVGHYAGHDVAYAWAERLILGTIETTAGHEVTVVDAPHLTDHVRPHWCGLTVSDVP